MKLYKFPDYSVIELVPCLLGRLALIIGFLSLWQVIIIANFKQKNGNDNSNISNNDNNNNNLDRFHKLNYILAGTLTTFFEILMCQK